MNDGVDPVITGISGGFWFLINLHPANEKCNQKYDIQCFHLIEGTAPVKISALQFLSDDSPLNA